MPTLYWIGGGANKNWSTAANWATASAGLPFTAAPTSSDNVIFNGSGSTANSDSNIDSAFSIKSLFVSSSYTAAISHSANLTIIGGKIEFGPSASISGSINQTISLSGSSTIMSNGKSWPGTLTLDYTNAGTNILSGSLTISGSLIWKAGSSAPFNSSPASSMLTTYGGLLPDPATGRALTGTAQVTWAGGRWYVQNNLNAIYNLSTLIISGSVEAMGRCVIGAGGTINFIYLTGSISASKGGDTYGPELQHRGGTIYLNTFSTASGFNMIIWGLTWANAGTYVLVTDASASYCASAVAGAVLNANTGVERLFTPSYNIYPTNGTITGSATVVITGSTGCYTSIGQPSTGYFATNIVLSGNGTIAAGNYGMAGGAKLTYLTGSWTTAGAILDIRGSCALDLKGSAGLVFDGMGTAASADSRVTLSSSLFISRSFSINSTANITFTGSTGTNAWSCETLTSTVASGTTTLQSGSEYFVRRHMFCSSSRAGSKITLASNSATERAFLTVSNTGSMVTIADFTRIDASNGRTIRSFNGTITDCRNIESITDLQTNASSFISSF